MITASHNPYKYNGFKLKDEFGGSMGSEILSEVENKLPEITKVQGFNNLQNLIDSGIVEIINGREYYLNNLKSKVDIEKIKNANLSILYDVMFGAGQNSI